MKKRWDNPQITNLSLKNTFDTWQCRCNFCYKLFNSKQEVTDHINSVHVPGAPLNTDFTARQLS